MSIPLWTLVLAILLGPAAWFGLRRTGLPSSRAMAVAGVLALTPVAISALASGARERSPLFGFSDNAVRAGALSASADARLTAGVGANVQRVVFDWRWAEQRPGHIEFGPYDRIYRALRAKGIRPVFILMFAPQWTWQGDHPCNQYTQDCRFPPSPRFYGAWRRIAAQLARRYPRSAGIEIWNEPNLGVFWQPRPDAARYVQLLREAYRAIKRVRRSMPVVLGGLNDIQASPGGDVPLSDYINQLYQHGVKGAMDAIGVHPYPLSVNDWRLFEKSLRDVRSVRDRNGDRKIPLWITEIGLSTTGPLQQGGGLTEEQQAQGLVSLYRRLRAMPDVKAIFIHTLIEDPGIPTDVNVGYGVVRRDLSTKPAYCALAGERDRHPCR